MSAYIISEAFHTCGPVRNVSYHNEYELIFIEKGSMELTIGNVIYTAERNSLILLSNLEQKNLKLQCVGNSSRYCLFFNAPVVDVHMRNFNLLSILKNHSEHFCHCMDVSQIRDSVVSLLSKMLQCDPSQPYANEMVAAYLTELLVLLCWSFPQLIPVCNGPVQEHVWAVQHYIDAHYGNAALKIADVCKQHYISPHYLSHQFKLVTGYSPKQYLLILRLKHSALLLQNSNQPVSEIAWQCGFADINNFCKQFKREYGCTASQFRISNQRS